MSEDRFYYLRISVLFLGFSVLSIMFELVTEYDFIIANWFFNNDNAQWILDKSNPGAYLIFYSGIKTVYGIVWLICLVLLLAKKIPDQNRPGMKIFLWSVVWSSILIGIMKSTTNMACPKDLINYGGNILYKSLFEGYSPLDLPKQVQRCFPAGHAGFGYSFISVMFIPLTRSYQFVLASVAFCIGTAMGTYKMLIGDHFMSHTLASLFISLSVIHLTAYFTLQNHSLSQICSRAYVRSSSFIRQRIKRAPSPPVAAR